MKIRKNAPRTVVPHMELNSNILQTRKKGRKDAKIRKAVVADRKPDVTHAVHKHKKNLKAWVHLRNVLSSGRKNRGRLIFMLRGFLRVHQPETWCDNTVELFARFARVSNPENFHKRVCVIVEAFGKVSTDNTRMAFEMMRAFEVSRMRYRKTKRSGNIDEFGQVGVIHTIADELEVSYGPWNKAAA
ncbi:MAG: hypothetical protein R3B55_00720 [Candidatus Paceibacterota bacterium]